MAKEVAVRVETSHVEWGRCLQAHSQPRPFLLSS